MASLLAFVLVILALADRGKRVRREDFIYVPDFDLAEVIEEWLRNSQNVNLVARPESDAAHRHFLQMQTGRGDQLAAAEELRIDLSPLPDGTEILEARMVFAGAEGSSQKAFHLAEVIERPDKISLRFLPGPAIHSPETSPDSVLLEVVAHTTEQLAVLVQTAPDEPPSRWLWVKEDFDGDPRFASVYGQLRFGKGEAARYSRAELLAHMWGFTVGGKYWIYLGVSFTAAAWVVGLGLLVWRDWKGGYFPAGARMAMGVGLLSLSLCSSWALLVPPWHGPDEPDHYLSFAELNKRPHLVDAALDSANAGHFSRLVKRMHEKFTGIDVPQARDDAWPHYIGPVPPDRSALGTVLWTHFPSTRNTPVGESVLFLRLGNGAFLSILLGLALTLAWRVCRDAKLLCWAAPVLLIPAVPFYGVMISNYPYLTAGLMVQAVAWGILWAVARKPADWPALRTAGLLGGLGLSLALSAAENGLVTLPLWLVILASFYAVVGQNNFLPGASLTCALRTFFLPLAAAVFVFATGLCFLSPQSSWLPGRLTDLITTSTKLGPMPASMFFAALLVFVFFTVAALAGLAAPRFRCALPRPASIQLQMGVLALVVIALLILPRAEVPEITINQEPVTRFEYASQAVKAYAQSLTPRQPNVYVSTSFWSRLGWQDLRLPVVLRDILRWFTGIGVVSLLGLAVLRPSFSGEGFMAWSSVLAVFACVTSVALLYHHVGYNVHGRYLLAPYVFLVALAGLGLVQAVRFFLPGPRLSPRALVALLALVSITVQTTGWLAVLNRYF